MPKKSNISPIACIKCCKIHFHNLPQVARTHKSATGHTAESRNRDRASIAPFFFVCLTLIRCNSLTYENLFTFNCVPAPTTLRRLWGNQSVHTDEELVMHATIATLMWWVLCAWKLPAHHLFHCIWYFFQPTSHLWRHEMCNKWVCRHQDPAREFSLCMLHLKGPLAVTCPQVVPWCGESGLGLFCAASGKFLNQMSHCFLLAWLVWLPCEWWSLAIELRLGCSCDKLHPVLIIGARLHV